MKHLLTLNLLIVGAINAQTPVTIDFQSQQNLLEYTGQVTNSGTASIQVGYFNFVKGFNSVFSGSAQDETTALFTFYTTVNQTRSVLNGTVRIVDREGTTTIYLSKGPADFSNLDSFRAGTAIQTSSIRQQVVVDTVSSVFTVSNFNVVNSVNAFTVGSASYLLGAPGQNFRTTLTGRLTSTAPPSGYFGGLATGTTETLPFLYATPNPATGGSNGVTQVTLNWGAPGASSVEVHIGAPDGALFTAGGSTGSAMTPAWVVNGMEFFLQDVSGGRPLTAANTLAQLAVVVR